jgi:precorrin-2 dehydrogenase/sirohydrochlorin ferrochelatase
MQEFYFPAFLDLRGQECVVVGGGEVAAGKVLGLLPCGARVRVISPEAHPHIRRLAGRGTIRWESRDYRSGDLDGAFLAVAATDEPAVNDAVYRDAVAGRVLVNVVDVPDRCQFVYGAIFRRGRMQVAISTGGASPALASRVKAELGRALGVEYGQIVNAYRRLRGYVRRRIPTVEGRKRFWLQLVMRDDALDLLRAGRRADAEALLRQAVDTWQDPGDTAAAGQAERAVR